MGGGKRGLKYVVAPGVLEYYEYLIPAVIAETIVSSPGSRNPLWSTPGLPVRFGGGPMGSCTGCYLQPFPSR